MRCLFIVIAMLGCVPTAFAQAPVSPPPEPGVKNPVPSAAATGEIAARRDYLKAINVWDSMPRGDLKEAEVATAVAQLESALRSKDAHVYYGAVQDLMNSQYRAFPPDAILKLLLPSLSVRETDQKRITAQGFIIEHLARHYGPKAKDALPELLRIVKDAGAPTYVRGQAIEAAARIGPGDKAVVDAFIVAATNPEPKNTSGVHDRIAERLGEMGKAAWPAKPALLAIFNRAPWYEDDAALALGKLALDNPPRPLGDYLDRLAKLDRLPLEQAAAAFIHVQRACLPGAALRSPRFMALQPNQVNVAQALAKLDRKNAERVRPVLLKIVADRPGGDVYIRSALCTLAVIGPGASPAAARVLVDVLARRPFGKTHEARNEARAVLALFEPGDKAAVPIFAEAFNTIGKDESHEWLSRTTLAQLIARYGKDARPAVPALICNLERFRTPTTFPQFPVYEEVAACVDALAAAGGDAPAPARPSCTCSIPTPRCSRRRAAPIPRCRRICSSRSAKWGSPHPAKSATSCSIGCTAGWVAAAGSSSAPPPR